MKILIAAPYAINTPHYETALELMQLHLDQGDEVVMLECDADQGACDVNPEYLFRICAECIHRRHAGLRLLSGSGSTIRTAPILRLTPEDRAALAALPLEFDDVAALKRFAPEGFDLGYGVLSSLISRLRDSEPDLASPAIRPLLRRFIATTYAVYRSFRNHLAVEKPDRVYVYNGRYAATRAVFRACQQAGVECMIHETGSTLQHYALFRNHLPHSIADAERLAREAWAAADPARREALADEYYRNLSRGVVGSWFAYTRDQQAGLLPPGWDASRTNIAIYNSSEDEFLSLSDEWRPPIYASQAEGLQALVEAFRGDDRVRLTLRVHPNQRHARDGVMARLAQLSAPNFTLVPPESPVSSYALLRAADSVFTFGSSMGIEATYWGKPSILGGISMYRGLGATHNPQSHAEVVAMLRAGLAPMPREGALVYGHYRKTFGTPFKYFHASGVFDGEFKSTRLRPGALARGAYAAAQKIGLGPALLARLRRGRPALP